MILKWPDFVVEQVGLHIPGQFCYIDIILSKFKETLKYMYMYLLRTGDAKISLDGNRPVNPGEPSTSLPSICDFNSMGTF